MIKKTNATTVMSIWICPCQ